MKVGLEDLKNAATFHCAGKTANASVVSDARRKAIRAGADYFFTWNVNECVLWETQTPTDDPAAGQPYKSWKVVSVVKESHSTLPSTEDAIKSWLGQFLNELANPTSPIRPSIAQFSQRK